MHEGDLMTPAFEAMEEEAQWRTYRRMLEAVDHAMSRVVDASTQWDVFSEMDVVSEGRHRRDAAIDGEIQGLLQ
jgi:hypothetical protein